MTSFQIDSRPAALETKAMPKVLVIQPIHSAGYEKLNESGVIVCKCPSYDDATVLEQIADVDAVITRSAGLQAFAMDRAPRLRAIVSHGSGVDAIDIGHATKLGIPVANTPGANSSSVAEHAIGLMLATLRSLTDADRAVRECDFNFKYRRDLRGISGKTLGLIGFGAIGTRVAAMARAAFGMRIVVLANHTNAASLEELGYEKASLLDDLLRESDVISLHSVVSDKTRGIIGEREFRLMKQTAILINTARGALVDERALLNALQTGQIAGAGLDVFSSESMSPDNPILSAPNTVFSPHIGGSTVDALEATAVAAAEHILALLSGSRLDVINTECWDRRRH
ncbi:hydroxyacid dehydrogenase [Mesorhizobium sp. WSM4887]|uniref:hydroxyacid dehydrogenase n=1 Tax=Mesorhizobium sp. WSM4887 TaxID=3038543 RepID=UPI002416BC7F|nr:hydroxyacid dehydrogenase [Mesorhizobium sp. WSM4887]MDG4889809.1 hydroxyacid dehydrogenase [Mesorhizobium sp. WSM4887]